MDSREYDERTCVARVGIDDSVIGSVVDTVNEVADTPEEHVWPSPRMSKDGGSRYIQAMGKTREEVKILLDVQRLL